MGIDLKATQWTIPDGGSGARVPFARLPGAGNHDGGIIARQFVQLLFQSARDHELKGAVPPQLDNVFSAGSPG